MPISVDKLARELEATENENISGFRVYDDLCTNDGLLSLITLFYNGTAAADGKILTMHAILW